MQKMYQALFSGCITENRLENKTNYTLCVLIFSLSFFYHYMAFCTALSPFTYDIVILGLCKWQLTHWVGVNAAVHNVAIGKENKWSTTYTTKCIQYIYVVYENLQDEIGFELCIGVNLSEPHTSVVYGNTRFDRPTDWQCPSQSHDTDMLHVPTLPRHAHVRGRIDNIAYGFSRLYYPWWWWTVQCKNADDGQAKSREEETPS